MKGKELWVQNVSKKDESIDDLGLRVRVGSTINVYKSNPYLTKDKVNASVAEGSIAKKVKSGSLEIVHGPTKKSNNPPIKESVVPLKLKVQNKTSVVVDTTDLNDYIDGELGDFADYGTDDLENNVSYVSDDQGGVLVEQKVDQFEEKTEQKTTLRDLGRKALVVDPPKDKVYEPVSTDDEFFAELEKPLKPNKKVVVVEAEEDPKPEKVKSEPAAVTKDDKDTVVVEKAKDNGKRSISEIKKRQNQKDYVDSNSKKYSTDNQVVKSDDGAVVVGNKKKEEKEMRVLSKSSVTVMKVDD